MRINTGHARHGILGDPRTMRRKVLSIAVMLLLLVGLFGLFAGLVFFSQGVIAPDATP